MARDLNVDQIKKLWTLDLVLRSGTFRKAALQAKVSPSAISQSVSSLEESVGKPLLVRDRGLVEPTAEALAILEVVRPAFAAFDRLRERNQAPVPPLAWLNFGTYESLAIEILPGLLESLRNRMPHLRLGLRVSRTASLLTMVRKGELCSALVTETEGLDRFYCRDVAEDRLGVYVSRRHPCADLGWEAVARLGYGSLAPGKDGLPRYFSRFLRQLEASRPLLVSDSLETLRAAAAAGAVAAVLPERVARREPGLLEIRPRRGAWKEAGRHRICVVSLASCDPAETDFLATEIDALLRVRA